MSEPSVSSLDFMREQPFLVGDWRVEPTSGRIVLGSTEVKLEPRVMDLLLCLASRPGEVFSRVQLESTVWAGMVVGYDSLTSAMIKLRKAFNDDSRNPQIIETVSKRGYRLLAKVSFDPPQAGRVIEETSQVTIKEESPRRRLHHYSTFAIVSCLLLMALWFFIKEESPTRPQAIGDTPERVGLVVLPFINMNDDPSQEYFSDGITDDLIVDLSRYSGLLVIARRSAFSYKSRNADIPTLARELNVGYVVEGSVRRDHDKVRVNVQLVDTATGMNIWVQRFEERTDDLFSVQDDIRKNIIRSLSVKLTEEEHRREQRRYTNSFEAYDYFLRGQSNLVKRSSDLDNTQARSQLEKAIALDPQFARAYAALALTYADAYRFSWSDSPKEAGRLALEYAEKAVELDAHLPQALWIMGYVELFINGDHASSIRMAERTIEIDPSNANAYTLLAVANVYNGRAEKAKQFLQQVKRVNPHYPSQVPSVLGLAHLLMGEYQEALAAYDESLLINPTRIPGNVYKLVTLYRMGRSDEANWQREQLMSLHPQFSLEDWARLQPFSDPVIVKDLVGDLEKVGVPH